MKTCVYGVFGNNIGDIVAWWQSARSADHVVALCVNSYDGTAKFLQNLGATVVVINHNTLNKSELLNIALNLTPVDTDVCVRLDAEQLLSPDWLTYLDQFFTADAAALAVFLEQPDRMDQPQTLRTLQIHSRHSAIWRGSCLPVLDVGEQKIINLDQKLITSYKRWVFDLDALKKSYNYEKTSTHLFLLARELMLNGQPQEASKLFREHFETFRSSEHEIGEACYWLSILEPDDALGWLRRGAAHAPWRRESWFYLSRLYRRYYNWIDTLSVCITGISLAGKAMHWLDNDQAHGCQLYIWGADAAIKLTLYDRARELLQQGLQQYPGNPDMLNMIDQLPNTGP